jgi:NitT/TauT family transport system substrate-binding protein
MIEIKIMVSRHSVFYSPVIALVARPFLEKEGLSASYHILPHGTSASQEVASGRMDVGQAAVSVSWRELEKGERPSIAHFAQINTRDGFFVAAREPDRNFTWDKLKSGKFMYVHGGQPEAMLRYGAFKLGVDLDDVEGINKPTTRDMMDSWRKGEGDYFHEQGPYPQQLEFEGCAHIVACVGDAIGPVAFSSLICRWDWLETEEARRFTNAYRASREWVRTADPEEVARAEAGFFPDISIEAVSNAIRTYQGTGTWDGTISIPEDLYENALDVFEYSRLIEQRHAFERVVVSPPS